MIDVQALKRSKAALVTSMRSITDKAEQRDNHSFTESEKKEWEKLDLEARGIGEEIERSERMNELEIEEARNNPKGPLPAKEEDKELRNFANLGEFLQAVQRSASPGVGVEESLAPYAVVEKRGATGQNVGIASEGGFAIQTDFVGNIFDRMVTEAVLAPMAFRIQIGPNANGIRMNSFDSDSRKTGSRFGGVVAYYAKEAGTVDPSKMKFRDLKMDLEKGMVLLYVTEEQMQDSVQLGQLSELAMASEMAFLVDDAVFDGSGAGKPLGFMKSKALITVAKEPGQPKNTIVAENIFKMRSQLWSKSRSNYVWLINQEIEPELSSMALSVGTGGIPVYLPANGLNDSPYDRLSGRQVIPIEFCEGLGTKGDICAVDMSQYLLIEKGGIKKDFSIHVRYVYDEGVFKVTYRHNGQPLWENSMLPYKGTKKISPFITLADRLV